MNPTERSILFVKAQGIREAAGLMVGEDFLFDSDHDNALVSARLLEIADRYDERAKS